MSRINRLAGRFADDTRGAIAVIFGLSLLVLACCAALALDSSRVYNIKSHVQAALDAASLAGAKALNPDDFDEGKIRTVAEAHFNAQANMIQVNDVTLTNFQAVPNLQDRTVAATIDVQISSIFGRLSGLRQNLNFTPSSVTKHVSRKVEVALVVDITGSMCSPCTKIDDLKAAAKEMIDVLYSSFPEPGAIRVSLVPYSASVNVGATYLEDVAAYNDAIDTCVMEREGINTYTNAVPVNGSLFETTGNTPASDRPGYSCPDSEIVPLTDLTTVASRDAFKAKIDVLNPSGATAGHIGLAWGWYMLTPEWSSVWPGDSAPKPYREDVTKTLILMTDGMFNRSYWNNGHTLSDSERLDPLVPGSSGYQALQLCGAITDRVAAPFGPKLYTVSFMAPPEADALMQQCAGAGNAYTAENRASLTAAFTEIVNRLTSLAVTN